jgi:hypothetical protein
VSFDNINMLCNQTAVRPVWRKNMQSGDSKGVNGKQWVTVSELYRRLKVDDMKILRA